MARRSRSSAIIIALVLVAASTTMSAHRLDALLQAARIGIADGRVDVELDLTPGVALADRLIADVDRDGDGQFSAPERKAYVDRVVAALTLRSDDTVLTVAPSAFSFPAVDALRSGDAAITIHAFAPLPPPSAGPHRLRFENRHQPGSSLYLANALVPGDDRIAITAQDRDGDQQQLTIRYTLLPAPGPSTGLAVSGIMLVVAAAAAWRVLCASPRWSLSSH